MWGNGGKLYWGKTECVGRKEAKGIIVVFAWIWSDERQLIPFIDLYWSLGWRCLICHADFLTLFFPEKATTLACEVLNELAKELKIEPLPVIFATFSGGSTGCMCKVLQLLDAKFEGESTMDEYQIIRECICGQIYDSSLVDFTTGDMDSVHRVNHRPRFLSWMGKALASGFDTLFPSSIETQRAEYWQTLYSSVGMGPFLIFCTDDDKLAPYRSVCSSAQRLADLGADVSLIKWSNTSSPHIGHYKFHQAEYRIAVTEFLSKALTNFSYKRRQINNSNFKTCTPSYKIAQSVCNLHEAAASSNESLRRADHFFLPSSLDSNSNSNPNENGEEGNLMDEQQRRELFHLPQIEPQGVLGQILYDVCVPKNIEGWDIKPGVYLKDRQAFANSRRLGPFNPIKCLRRSRL